MSKTHPVQSAFLSTLMALMLLTGTLASTSAEARRDSQRTISATDTADLLWMREEEKVARDVYLHLGQTFNHPVFANIATSEQRHMDAIKARLDKYGLADPALPNAGDFTNPALQSLYADMIAQGSPSVEMALRVGAYIEEADILDLLDAMERTRLMDLKTVYQNLLEGSRHHLRAFVNGLEQLGMGYEPKLMDPETYALMLDR